MQGLTGKSFSGLFLTIISSVLWGTSFLFIGYGLQYTDPYTLVFLRFGLTTAAILPLSFLLRGLNIVSELKRPSIWLLGGVNAVGYLFQFAGQSLSSAAEASLLSTLYPVIVPFFALAILRDRIGKMQVLATVLGFTGLILVMVPGLDFHSLHFAGDMLLLLTSVSYALFIVIGKKVPSSTADSIFALMVVDTVILFIPAVLLGKPLSIVHTTALGWVYILWLAFACTLVATALYLRGLTYMDASRSATLLFLELVTGFILSVLAFGEPDLLIRGSGAAVISVSIIISSLPGKRDDQKGEVKGLADARRL